MKNMAKFLSLLLALTMLFSMSSCFAKKLSGKYKADYESKAKPTLSGTFVGEENGVEVSYTFKNGELTMKMMGIEIEGTYELREKYGEYVIDLTVELLGQGQTVTNSISAKNANTIVIDGMEYKAEGNSVKLDLQPTQFEFSGKNVEMTVEGYFLGKCVYDETFEGTYSIKKDEITFEFDDKDAKDWNDTFDFEEKGDNIEIDGIKYES